MLMDMNKKHACTMHVCVMCDVCVCVCVCVALINVDKYRNTYVIPFSRMVISIGKKQMVHGVLLISNVNENAVLIL